MLMGVLLASKSYHFKASLFILLSKHRVEWYRIKLQQLTCGIERNEMKHACLMTYPIGSMYGIFPYIYHENQPNVGKNTIHGWYGAHDILRYPFDSKHRGICNA